MKSITANYFVCKVRYEKVQEDGLAKKITETYVVDAVSFGEAEKRITEEISQYVSGDFSVEDITKAPFNEVFFSDAESADKWYKAKLAFITIDEATSTEKRSNVVYLVQAGSLNDAVKNIDCVMSTSMTDYSSLAVQETTIMDVFLYKK